MKTKQIILPAVLAAFTAGGIAAYNLSTFASDEASSTTTDKTSNCGPEGMSGHRGGMRGERMGGGMFGVQQYIDVDSLTDDQKTTYETALNTFHETMKTNMQANKDSTGNNTATKEAMTTAWTTFMQSVRPLVSSDKLTEFDAFVAKGPQAPTMGQGKGEGRGERMGGMFGIQQYIDFDSLTGDTKTAFDAIVKDHQEKVKAAIESAKATSGDNTATQETMKTLWTEFMTSIRPYVSSDKLTDFDAFVAKGPQAPAMSEGKGMGRMGGGMFGVQQYIEVSTLTDDQKTTYETALNTFHETMKTNMEANKDSTGDNTAMQESMKTAWTTFMQSVRPLVSSDKLTEFDAFVAKGPQAPAMGEGKGEGRGERMGGGMGRHSKQSTSSTDDSSQTDNE